MPGRRCRAVGWTASHTKPISQPGRCLDETAVRPVRDATLDFLLILLEFDASFPLFLCSFALCVLWVYNECAEVLFHLPGRGAPLWGRARRRHCRQARLLQLSGAPGPSCGSPPDCSRIGTAVLERHLLITSFPRDRTLASSQRHRLSALQRAARCPSTTVALPGEKPGVRRALVRRR